jgi:hypothetical protein
VLKIDSQHGASFLFFYLNIEGWSLYCGHFWPIVPALGDCEDGEAGGMNGFGRGN